MDLSKGLEPGTCGPAAASAPRRKGRAAGGCDNVHNRCIEAAFENHKVRAFATWEAEFAEPLADRMGAVSTDLVDYVTLHNQVNGYSKRPRAIAVDPQWLRDAKAPLAEVPPAVQNLLVSGLQASSFCRTWAVQAIPSTQATVLVRMWQHSSLWVIYLDFSLTENPKPTR